MNPESKSNLACKEILVAIESGKEQVIVSPFIFSELYFILDRDGISPNEIRRKLNAFLNLRGIHPVVYDPFLLKSSFNLFAKFEIDLIDATNIQLMRAFQLTEIYSLDTHFDKFKGIVRLTQLSIKN